MMALYKISEFPSGNQTLKMKKLLLLLLCVPLLFSCGEKDNDTENTEKQIEELEGKDTTELITNFNGIIEINEDSLYYIRNTSKNKKYEFTVTIIGLYWTEKYIEKGEMKEKYQGEYKKKETQKIILLSPGEKKSLGHKTEAINNSTFNEYCYGKDITYT